MSRTTTQTMTGLFTGRGKTLLLIALAAAGAWTLAAPGADAEQPAIPDAAPSPQGYVLEQLSYSPGLDAMVGICGRQVDGPIQVRVLKDGKPVAGQTVDFLIVGQPPKSQGAALRLTQAPTDSAGIAASFITLGSKDGDYLVAATLNGSVRQVAPQVTRITAMEPGWIAFLIIGLLGGLGLFLYGMNIAGDNLQKAWGEQMRHLLGKLTKNRFSAVLVGTGASGVLQSSSAASVMVVGFVSAGMMTLVQAISVIIGTKIGVTITLQVLAFNISKYALAVVGMGAIMIMAAGKREKMMHIGAILLGFGLIFFGLSTMSGAMRPLRGMPEFANMMLQVSESPGLAILVGTAFTAIIQSSVATIAICMALATQGLLSLPGALGLAIGSTVGTCATALLACLGSNRDGKRVAISHLVFSVLAALVSWPLLGLLADGAGAMTGWLGSDSAARGIANGVMIFSILAAALFLPFVAQLQWLTMKILPAGKEEETFAPKFINEAALGVPVMALEQAQKEVERMADLFGDNLRASLPAILAGDKARIDALIAEDDKLDILEKAIRPYLARVAQKGLAREAAARERALIYITEDIEGAGDLLTKEVLHAGEKVVRDKLSFSEEGVAELTTFHEKIVNKFERVIQAVRTSDRVKAEETLQLSFKEKQLERKLRDAHLARLHAAEDGEVTARAGHYLSILAGLAAVGGKLDAVAEEVLREI